MTRFNDLPPKQRLQLIYESLVGHYPSPKLTIAQLRLAITEGKYRDPSCWAKPKRAQRHESRP